MKRSWVVVLLAAAGVVAFQYRQMPTYAASGSSPSSSAGLQPASGAGISGAETYADHCAVCHGDNREGNLPGFPPLQGITRRMTDEQITQLVRNGKGRMPAFAKLEPGELTALLHYLSTDDQPQPEATKGSSSLAETGGLLFQQNCAFCHGRDTQGGEAG